MTLPLGSQTLCNCDKTQKHFIFHQEKKAFISYFKLKLISKLVTVSWISSAFLIVDLDDLIIVNKLLTFFDILYFHS
jgi:hypothetical protein